MGGQPKRLQRESLGAESFFYLTKLTLDKNKDYTFFICFQKIAFTPWPIEILPSGQAGLSRRSERWLPVAPLARAAPPSPPRPRVQLPRRRRPAGDPCRGTLAPGQGARGARGAWPFGTGGAARWTWRRPPRPSAGCQARCACDQTAQRQSVYCRGVTVSDTAVV